MSVLLLLVIYLNAKFNSFSNLPENGGWSKSLLVEHMLKDQYFSLLNLLNLIILQTQTN